MYTKQEKWDDSFTFSSIPAKWVNCLCFQTFTKARKTRGKTCLTEVSAKTLLCLLHCLERECFQVINICSVSAVLTLGMTFWYSLQNTLCIAEYKAFKTPFFKMHFLWFSYLKRQPWKHDFVAAGETARCHMSDKDELQSPPQQTADHNLTSLPNVSIIVSFPDGHLCENTWLIGLFQSPVLSLCIRNHHCHLIFQTPSLFSCSVWAPLQCDGCDGCNCSIARGTENAKASTENWNQTSKIHQSSFNVRTNKQL